MTRQRSVILDELRKTCAHPTAEELFETVRARLPRISLGTVYRNLELLSESGEVRKIDVGGRRRYDGNVEDEHYHARCTVCGRIEDVSSTAVTALDYRIEEVRGFTVTGHLLTFIGLCPECVRAAEKRN
ncbi:MAG: transcriptional repressor [FCB group bacterium]|jgi:Fur family ferric uptake transcriptional regulator|nr:transcriptional repressor [FCB group bacterium]